MTGELSEATIDLSRQIRTELSEPSPEGFQFQERVVRQDAALERLSQSLAAHQDARQVEQAMSHALQAERNGWVLLKLIELTERLALLGAATALLEIARQPPEDGDRRTFLAGRACEVLLKLPLDLKARAEANQVCEIPLQRVAEFRLGTQKERLLQRPRHLEWILLAVLMGLGVGGFLYALFGARAG